MIIVCLDGVKQDLGQLSESWLREQIQRRRVDGVAICIRVEIRTPQVNVSLATSGCSGHGGGRQPNLHEKPIIDLWNKFNLGNEGFNIGQLIAFLKQAQQLF